ncbi:MAG: YqgE/AlgH family protein [Acidimicrobiales bacterium]
MPAPPAKGRLLVATPALEDPNFYRTVVFLLAADGDGALGVVLNRPSDTSVDDIVPHWGLHASAPPVLFSGGPVQPNAAICVGRVETERPGLGQGGRSDEADGAASHDSWVDSASGAGGGGDSLSDGGDGGGGGGGDSPSDGGGGDSPSNIGGGGASGGAGGVSGAGPVGGLGGLFGEDPSSTSQGRSFAEDFGLEELEETEGNGYSPLVGSLGTVDLNRGPEDIPVEFTGLRVFTGYSGWGPGQLEDEIEAGGWFVIDGQEADVLSAEPDRLWERVLRRQGGWLSVLARHPADPSLN